MKKSTLVLKQAFESEFYLISKEDQESYRGKTPILTWINECKKPSIELEFLLHAKKSVKLGIALLLDRFSLNSIKQLHEEASYDSKSVESV